MGGQWFCEDVDIHVSPKRFWWACVKDGHNFAVKCVPHKMAKASNDGDSFGEVGTARTVHFHNGLHRFDFVRATVEEVDEEKLYLKMDLIDGNSEGTASNSYKLSMHFMEGVIKYTIECKAPRESHFLEDVKEFMYYTLTAMDASLVANENEYKC